mgnify:CR=1 FL=1
MGRSMTSPLSPEAVAQMVADLTDGLDMAAEAEVLVIDGLEKYVTLFQADDRDTKTMRALRVYNEAKNNHRRFVNEACALRAIAAENASLRAEQAMLKFDIDKMLTQIEEHNAAWDELRASEAAAVARADHARDAALVEAAAVAIARKGNGEATLDHPYDKGYLAACDSCAASILALRDKPAPAVTVQKAILEVWGCCEELEDEALAKLSGVKTEHEKGFWTGQKMTAKRIRRATQMPIAGGGDE